MAGSASDYLELELLDHVLGGADYARPANVYVGLYTVAPTDSTAGTECSGGDYARVEVTNNATNWPAASTGSKANGAAITFPTATAGWGTVVAWGIFDAASGGNLLIWAIMATSRAVLTGDTPSFGVGVLVVTLD